MSALLAQIAATWRIAFLMAGAPVVGAVLLLAIGRLTGARWQAFAPMAAAAPWLVAGAVLLGLAQAMVAAPLLLHMWLAWWAVLLRGVFATSALSLASARLRRGASESFAAITLAAYAIVVTPLAFDWMLGFSPGHAVSAIGLMQLAQSIGSAAATALVLQMGSPAFRRDMARLMIAAMLGLAYLGYMDFLIVWYGNLPAHVGFYLMREPGVIMVWAGLAVGLAGPILLLWLAGEDRGQRPAGVCVLIGMALLDAWWVSGGVAAILGGLLLGGLLFVPILSPLPGEVSRG